MDKQSPFSDRVIAVCLFVFLLFTFALPLLHIRSLARSEQQQVWCETANRLHERYIEAVLRLRSTHITDVNTDRCPPATSLSSPTRTLLRLRSSAWRAAAKYRSAVAMCTDKQSPRRNRRRMRLDRQRQRHEDALEFCVTARHAVDGVIMYVIGLIGARSRRIVELDGALGASALRVAAAFSLYDGWDVVVLHSRWSAYSASQIFYEQNGKQGTFDWRKHVFPDATVLVAEEALSTSREVQNALVKHGVGGDVDLLSLTLDGPEYDVWRGLSGVSPRMIMVFYQDYWGANESLVRKWNGSQQQSITGVGDPQDKGRRRLFGGASLPAFQHLARQRGYRLCWCFRRAPLAIFIRIMDFPRDGSLPTLDARSCIARRESTTWRRDMEAQWNAAQHYDWERVFLSDVASHGAQ